MAAFLDPQTFHWLNDEECDIVENMLLKIYPVPKVRRNQKNNDSMLVDSLNDDNSNCSVSSYAQKYGKSNN